MSAKEFGFFANSSAAQPALFDSIATGRGQNGHALVFALCVVRRKQRVADAAQTYAVVRIPQKPQIALRKPRQKGRATFIPRAVLPKELVGLKSDQLLVTWDAAFAPPGSSRDAQQGEACT